MQMFCSPGRHCKMQSPTEMPTTAALATQKLDLPQCTNPIG